MRADRVLNLLLLLQTRGKLTAHELADELEVSRRTILRDVDALSFAGVPIVTESGPGGGISLDERYRTSLTGLQTPEVQSLFVSRDLSALEDVGLGSASERLSLKLLAALPDSHRPTVDHIRQRLLIDPTWWWHLNEPAYFWSDLQRAVYEDRLIDVLYRNAEGESVERTLEPYSLVNKSGHWYVVARRAGDFRTYRVSRFQHVSVRGERFIRQADFDLWEYWQHHLRDFAENASGYVCQLLVDPAQESFVRWLLPGRWVQNGAPDERGWIPLRLSLDSFVLAKMLVFGLGASAEVVSPADLADSVLADARSLINRSLQQ